MTIIIGADHAGFTYKAIIVAAMRKEGYEVIDMGTNNAAPTDYPDHAADVAQAILAKKGERGILICGSAVGVSIVANKFKGIRAGVCHDTYSAHQGVEHDDVNILCLGERVIGIELALEIVFTFLKAQFTHEPRHERRLKKLFVIEDKNMKEERL